MSGLSVRSSILTRRSYCRPLNEEGTRFETFSQVLDRVIDHQRWLWERALGDSLNAEQEDELTELRTAMDARRVSAAGRTLWLGGTELVKRREASSFNCSYIEVRTVHDVVDVFWNLLQGCGVGFKPIKGALFGFTRRMEVSVIRSAKTVTDGKGRETNLESYDPDTKTWTISVGDSAESWAKLAGKLVAGKHPAKKLVIDLGEIRAGGSRLKGYGWICSGDGPLSVAIAAICEILNRRAGQLLSKNDISDIVNWLGTVLSSRRSAEIAILEYGDPEWREFATRKPPGFDSGPMWFRGQSNNSLLFWDRPTKRQLKDLFELMISHGGGEPGIINGRAAMARAPWFGGLNPCAEICLAVYGYCNLSEVDLAKYRGEDAALARDSWILARMNYRQTLVNLRDGVLQDAWHQTNENLRLCGVGITGIARRPDMTAYAYRRLRSNIVAGAYSMADELGLPRPGNVTTIKPSGCRPWHALTSTSQGILTLQELFEDHPDDTEWADYQGGASVLQGDERKPITRTYVNGESETVRITLGYGLSVESTLDHPWFVRERHRYGVTYDPVGDWVKASDIRPGDVIDVNPAIYDLEHHAPLQSISKVAVKMREDAADIRQPTEMNPDVAWLLGYLWGDGTMSPMKYRIRFVDRSPVNIAKAVRIFREQFGIEANAARASQGRDAYCLEVGSTLLWHWLIRNGVFKYFADRLDLIPRCVRSSGREDIIAFIAGLIDADGCCTANSRRGNNTLTLATADKFFADHVQHIAWSVGLGFGCSHNKLGQNFQARKSMYLMSLGNYVDSAAFDCLSLHSEKVAAISRVSGLPWPHQAIRKKGRVVGKVMAVEPAGVQRTYDIEVADNHWYYAGSIKSHNTLSKAIFDTTEGAHKPKARHIFNNVNFSRHDPLVPMLLDAGYRVTDHPHDPTSVLVTLPVSYPDVQLDSFGGYEVDRESAVSQMNRYKMLMDAYCDQNVSITVSYDPSEVGEMVDWLYANWDSYVAMSFLFRNDVTKTAKDLGFAYLPQETVTREVFDSYVSGLRPVDVDPIESAGFSGLSDAAECEGGACPVR